MLRQQGPVGVAWAQRRASEVVLLCSESEIMLRRDFLNAIGGSGLAKIRFPKWSPLWTPLVHGASAAEVNDVRPGPQSPDGLQKVQQGHHVQLCVVGLIQVGVYGRVAVREVNNHFQVRGEAHAIFGRQQVALHDLGAKLLTGGGLTSKQDANVSHAAGSDGPGQIGTDKAVGTGETDEHSCEELQLANRSIVQ